MLETRKKIPSKLRWQKKARKERPGRQYLRRQQYTAAINKLNEKGVLESRKEKAGGNRVSSTVFLDRNKFAGYSEFKKKKKPHLSRDL